MRLDQVRQQWDAHARRYDDWYATFEGAAEHRVDWDLLRTRLPADPTTRVLDGAGGTGRVALPLAEMGYRVTLCDLSPGMLEVARKKVAGAGLLDRVDIVECDLNSLPFDDERFDFVICWDGMASHAADELIRVTRRNGGRLSLYLTNKVGSAIEAFAEDPEAAIARLGPASGETRRDVDGYAYEPLSMDEQEAREFFGQRGVLVHEVLAVCGMLDLLSIPEATRDSREWDDGDFEAVTEMLRRLAREPSVRGLSRHLVLYGERE